MLYVHLLPQEIASRDTLVRESPRREDISRVNRHVEYIEKEVIDWTQGNKSA